MWIYAFYLGVVLLGLKVIVFGLLIVLRDCFWEIVWIYAFYDYLGIVRLGLKVIVFGLYSLNVFAVGLLMMIMELVGSALCWPEGLVVVLF